VRTLRHGSDQSERYGFQLGYPVLGEANPQRSAEHGATLPEPARSAHAGSGGSASVSRSHHLGNAARGRIKATVGVLAALVVWSLLHALRIVDPSELPSIREVVEAIGNNGGAILSGTGTTTYQMLGGLAGGSVVGGILGIAVGLSAWADASTDLLVRMMRPLPSLALIPVAILLLGLGSAMVFGLVGFATFWPVFINARYAVRSIEPRLLEVGRALGFRRHDLILRVVLPSTAPAIATGIRVAASVALIVTVGVELISGTGGLGSLVLVAEQGANNALLVAGVVAGGAVGWIVNLLTLSLSSRLLVWDARAVSRGDGR
jgi:NitT/TauT family transport system permease protein